MPQPIYMQKRVNPMARYLPYFLQAIQQKQKQKFEKKQAAAQAKLRPQEMIIGGRKGVYNPATQKWTEFKAIGKGWGKPVTAQEGNELGLPVGTGYQIGPKGKVHKFFEPSTKETPEQIEIRKRVGEVRKGIAQEAKEGRALTDKKALATYKHDLSLKLKKYGDKTPEAMTFTEKRMVEKDLRDTAQTIDLQPNEPAVKSSIKFYNTMATGNTVYYWNTGKKGTLGFGGERAGAIRVELPVDKNGIQITASDIRETLKKNPGKTLEDVLRDFGAIK